MTGRGGLPGVFGAVPLLVVLFCFGRVAAWHQGGHMVTAAVARLAVARKDGPAAAAALDAKVAALSHEAGYDTATVVDVAPWLDDVAGHGLRAFKPWHFINTVYNPDNLPVDWGVVEQNVPNGTTALVPGAVTWAVDNMYNGLKKCYPDGCSKWTTQFEQSFAVRTVVHLVGDLHQPLHCAARWTKDHPMGDLGGNLVKVYPPGANETVNLHFYWDGAAGMLPDGFDAPLFQRPLNPEHRKQIDDIAAKLLDEHPCDLPDGKPDDDVVAWGQQSYNLAVELVYAGVNDGDHITMDYQEMAQKLVRQQLARGGCRLAGLMREHTALPPPPAGAHSSGGSLVGQGALYALTTIGGAAFGATVGGVAVWFVMNRRLGGGAPLFATDYEALSG